MSRPRRLASLLFGAALVPLAFALTSARLLAAPFTDVGGPSGTGDTTDDVGVAWGDYDNDGDLDLYLAKDGSPNRLYRNNGNGTFTNVGASSGTANTDEGRGVAWGDYDSDGFLDLYLANDGPNRLYHNNGNGTFAEVGAASGTADGGSGRGVAWGDYDNDGDLDLYLANDGANRLYHNNGDGTFTEVGAATGTADAGNGVGVAWGDYDNDRDLDLYLANDNGTNRLYRNNGNGTFTETAAAAGCSDTGRSSGVAWGDYDNDGDLDLYVGKYGTANRLFRNNGNGTFFNASAISGTDDAGNATGVGWGDYDNDGDLDLYVANVLSANRHYRNNGNGTFTDVASSMGTNDPGNAQGVAWADYDNDGDLDLYLANVLGADRLYRNDSAVSPGTHWLHVNLVGSVSNRSGIGARVRCVTGATSRICDISGGSGYLSQGSLTAEFGLGVSAVDTVVVYWPSGLVQAVANPSVDQRLPITEAALFTEVGVPSGTDDIGSGYVGLAWGDYDGDGDPDLYLVKHNNEPNKLYRNNGNGTFTDVSAASGTNSAALGHAAAWADYDNDGDLDLYVSNEGASRLYRNNANGTFSDVATASGTENNANARGVTWGDYDDDNDLDLYVANHGGPNRLYRNDMNGTFFDVASATGTGDPQDSDNAAWGDYDWDGDLDLYVATFGGTNRLYRNNGNSTFTEVGAASGTADTGSSSGVDWADYDQDGDLDLYVAKYGTPNRLYRNNGNGTFTEVGATSGTADTGGSLGVAWADYDNDRDLDLYVSNDGGANRLYRNNNNGTFTDIGSLAGTGESTFSRGAAWADYDLDGDLDLYMAKDGSNRLYRNDLAVLPGRHWLHVDLVGRRSNRSGIGAHVRCVAGGVTSVRQVSGGSGYLSQGSLTAEFGLGTTATVDSLVVNWPSGIVQAVAAPSVDQRITVTEPESEYFTDVTQAAGTLGGLYSSAWVDYDNDDDLDLFIAADLLYRNNGNGTFTNVAAAAGIASNNSFAGSWADYDNDGDLDLYLPASQSLLYRNNGNGTFTDVATAAGTSAGGFVAAWGDYDGDGHVDLYVSHNTNDRLYKNNGNGTFTEVAGTAGTSAPSGALGLAWADYDNDGDLDIYVGGFGSDSTPNRLYRNNGNGTFNDAATSSGAEGVWTQGVSWGDYDNDGDLDLDIALWGDSYGNMLYKNLGNGTFTNWTGQAGVFGPPRSTAAVWGDYNNDGHLDLYVTSDNGSPSHLYRSAGNGTFSNVAEATGTNFSGDFQSTNWADYDNDGDLDLYLTSHRLCRNDNPARHWLHLKLVGTVSNRAAIGARVRCVAGGLSMISQISGGEGMSQGSLIAEFGLGASTTVDSLVISWPSGLVQAIVNPGIDRRITVSETEQFRFAEVGGSNGTNHVGQSYGVAWGDYDQDGDLDLYVSVFDQNGSNLLYRNNGDGTFTDRAAAAGTTGNGSSSTGVAWGDYDNDGDLDLYVGSYGANQLYRNNGNGTFTDAGAASGTNDASPTRGVAWGDFDADGRLDLYVANDGVNRLYRNLGNGTFTDVAAAAGVNDGGSGSGVAWGDYDADGDLDLYVANYVGATRLYRNNGNGPFTDVAAASGTAFTGPGIGVAWGDYDADGDLDLYLVNYGAANRLYRNNGNGTFAEVGATSGTDDGGLGRGAAWGDYDNDGHLDLFVSNEDQDRLYKNNGNGTFFDVGSTYGTDDGGTGVGAAWADYDNDGDLDLYLANYGSANRFYRNDGVGPRGGGNHWLLVDLVGTQSNRAGIGARVRCVAGGRNAIREISGGSGFLSQNALSAAFGLGMATVDTLEVRWPSGIVQTMVNPGADQRITITEQGTMATPEAASPVPEHYALYVNVPNPFNPVTTIRFDLPSAGTVNLTVFDATGRAVRKLVNGVRYEAGQQHAAWDGRTDQGSQVASGIYFYRIVANDFRATKRMTLLK